MLNFDLGAVPFLCAKVYVNKFCKTGKTWLTHKLPLLQHTVHPYPQGDKTDENTDEPSGYSVLHFGE